MTVLVLGGNGQLGAACSAELTAAGSAVRVTVRIAGRAEHLLTSAVDVMEVDLVSQPERRRKALQDVDTVIMTANSVVPRAGDQPGALGTAMADLVEEAVAAGVRRVVRPSVPVSSLDAQVPAIAARRQLENRLLASPLAACVLRMPPFMEVWLALGGSSVPLRGEPHATVQRPSPFLRTFRSVTGTLVKDRGVMLVPGSQDNRHAFLSGRDAARATATAASRYDIEGGVREVAGPEVLSWRDVAGIFGRVLERRIRVLTTPAIVYAGAAAALRSVAEVSSRTMALNRFMAGSESPWTSAGGGLLDPTSMVTRATAGEKSGAPSAPAHRAVSARRHRLLHAARVP